jgi:hypothetical protein
MRIRFVSCMPALNTTLATGQEVKRTTAPQASPASGSDASDPHIAFRAALFFPLPFPALEAPAEFRL